MTTPASYPGGANQAFSAGINHLANQGRGNSDSVTLGGPLQADGDHGLTPHSVLSSATRGSPADTDAAIDYEQQALGNTDDAQQARQSWDRSLMQQAANIGTDDNAP